MTAPVRVLTAEGIRADIDAALAAMKAAYAKARVSERDRQLLAALIMCGPFKPLPDWLYVALVELLIARLPPTPVNWVRWHLVLGLHDVSGLTWKETWKQASEMLEGTPAAGGPEAIRTSYKAIEKSLPPERKRKWTGRRKTTGHLG